VVRRDCADLRLRLGETYVRLEARNYRPSMAAAISELLGGEAGGRPEFGLRRQLADRRQVRGARELKLRTHDADDGVAVTIEPNGFATDLRVAPKAFLPQGVADYGNVVGARPVFFIGVGAPKNRQSAHQLEEARRGRHAGNALGE